MKKNYKPKNQRKKILLLSDDLRFPSGIGVMSKEIIVGTAHYYNWCQIGCAMKHVDEGKIINMDKALADESGVEDASLTLYPVSGYGNPELLRHIMQKEKPDAIMMFTDPRFWIWLFQMEHEIRQQIPIIYYEIWDDLPFAQFNKSYYESCSLLLGISKQTVNINKVILGIDKIVEIDKVDKLPDTNNKNLLAYVPHGINPKYYHPIQNDTQEYIDLLKKKESLFGNIEPEFVVLFNSRNIRRKMVSDIILSFKMFVDSLPKEKRDKSYLILHTQPIDEAGTNLFDVVEKLAKDCKIIFHAAKVHEQELNFLYNIADVTINVSSAEGWGLGNTESLMAGTMTITNAIGGLQDQLRFVDENDKWIEFSEYFPSNSCGKYKKCGEWSLPVFPDSHMVGSVPTPYIYDSPTSIKNVIEKLKECYDMGREERKRRGKLGHEWVMSDESMMRSEAMCDNMIKYIDILFDNWKPRERYALYNTKVPKQESAVGVYNPITKEWY